MPRRSTRAWAGALDADLGGGDFRIVQFNPPGSGCSIQFGIGLTSAPPGTATNLLVVSDIAAAHDDLVSRGAIDASEVFHDSSGGYNRFDIDLRASGPDPQGRTYASFMAFSDPDGNRLAGCRRSPADCPAGSTRRQPPSPRPAISKGRSSEPPRRTASTRSEPGNETRAGPPGTPPTCWPSRPAPSSRPERLRRHRPRRRLAGRALRRRARRGRPARRARRARAGRRRVFLLGLHPVQDAAAPRRSGARGARSGGERAGRRRGGARLARLHGFELLRRRPGALAGRPRASTCFAAAAGWPGPGVVEVDGVRHTADHVVVATGADPFIPPVPGLRGLEGVWTNREVTGMKAVPRRLLVLGGGPVGVEMAQAVRRLGGEVVIVDGPSTCCRASPAPLGEALGEALRRDGIELALGARRDRRRGARATTTSSSSRTVASCAATGCWSPPAGARASRASAWRRSASRPTRTGSRSTRACAPASGCGRSATSPASGRSPTSASTRARSSPPTSSASRARPTTRPCRASSTPIRRRRRSARPRPPSAPPPRFPRWPKTATYTRAYAESNGFLTLLSDGERLTGRLRARSGGRRVAAAGHAGDPGPRPARRAARHDPALPHLLGDLRRTR